MVVAGDCYRPGDNSIDEKNVYSVFDAYGRLLCIDTTSQSNEVRFLVTSDDDSSLVPNVERKDVWIEGSSLPLITFAALKDIKVQPQHIYITIYLCTFIMRFYKCHNIFLKNIRRGMK